MTGRSRSHRAALTFGAMTRLRRVAVLAVLLAATGCSSPTPTDPPFPDTSETAAPPSTPAGPASQTPAPAPAPAANIDGTLFFLGVGAAGGIYYLHNNVLTLAISDASFGFYQSATMSPDGQKLAWVLADAAGGTGQLRVQTYGGGTVTIGPSTISNLYPLQWSADSTSVIVGYGGNSW